MATAETIAKALGGRKAGGGWMARCPAHDDRTPSLSIRDADDGKVLVRCHAGCDQKRVIAALRGARSVDGERSAPVHSRRAARLSSASRIKTMLSAARVALAIWQSAMPARRNTGRDLSRLARPASPAPPTLRFHAGLKHPSGGIWPAMVALVTRGADERRSRSTAPFLPAMAAARRRSTRRR